jgi:hypothetical protein
VTALNRSQFLAILPPSVPANTFRQRNFRGEAMLAYRSTARENEFDPLDQVAVRVTEALATKTSNKQAADLTADTWPMWSDGVSVAETFPGGERPADEHIYLVIIDVGDDAYVARIGGLDGALKDLPTNTRVVHAVSIDRLLADLRAEAKAAGVPLPDRLAPAFGSPEYLEWRKTIDDEQTLPFEAAREAMIRARKEKAARLADVEAEANLLRREVKALRREAAAVSREHQRIHDAMDDLAKAKGSA